MITRKQYNPFISEDKDVLLIDGLISKKYRKQTTCKEIIEVLDLNLLV